MRLVIVFSLIVAMLEIFWVILRLSSIRYDDTVEDNLFSRLRKHRIQRVDCRYDSLGFSLDMFCNLFEGQVNYFSVVYISVAILTNLGVAIFGLYAWYKSFYLKVLEKFFYFHFVVTMFYFLDTCILNIIQTDLFLYALPSIFARAMYTFYINSVVYSYVLIKDKEYRAQRREEADGKLQVSKGSKGYVILKDSDT